MELMPEREMEMRIAGDEGVQSIDRFTTLTQNHRQPSEFDYCPLEEQFCFSGGTCFNRSPLKLLRPLPRPMVSENRPPTVANRSEHILLGGLNPALMKAEVPWSSRRRTLCEEEYRFKIVQEQKYRICCMILMTLNKFTSEQFDSLKYQLIESDITSADILKGFVSWIFEKATVRPTFCHFYAELFSDLNETLPHFPSNEPGGKEITFKQALLEKCREAFEGSDKLREEVKQMNDPAVDMEHRERLVKLRMLGNISLIGELFKQKLIPEKLLHPVIQELLSQADGKTCLAEENVERLCQFFNIVGKLLDDNPRLHQINDMHFSRLKELSSNAELAPHLRCMLQNVLDLRSNNWVPGPAEGGPATSLVTAEIPWSCRGSLTESDRVLKTLGGERYRTSCMTVMKLNRLTSEMYNLLKGRLIDSGISSADILKECVSLLYNKAVHEHKFCPMYAQLCSDLNEKLPPFPYDGPGGEYIITFRQILLNNCQEAFESTDELREEMRRMNEHEQDMEHREIERQVELRALGNISFIGELFMQKIFPEKIIHQIVQELLGQPDSNTTPADENVEAICQLFSVVGKQLDERQKSHEICDLYFSHLKELSTNSQMDACSRFMIQQLLDLRSNNWVTRTGESQNSAEKNLVATWRHCQHET